MNKIFFKLIRKTIFYILFSFPILIHAQNHNINNQKKQERKAQKVAFFTSKMQLTPVESQNFWPLVNEMEAEIKELKKKNTNEKRILKDKEEISDKELEEIMDVKMEMEKSQIDIKIKYHKKLKEVLPIKKVGKYYETSKEYRKLLAKRNVNKTVKHR